ncbi:MAG: S8 family serine peptidase [Planctomycetota bacterium]|nr:S8 family serine peptidase [Planctomycetota bacterium]
MLQESLRAAVAAALVPLGLVAQEAQKATPTVAAQPAGPLALQLKYGSFDPLVAQPPVPAALRADSDVGLHVVQLHRSPTDADRTAIRAAGGEIVSYLPSNAYVVRMGAGAAAETAAIASVRFVGAYQPAWRLEPFLLDEHVAGTPVPARRYHLVVADKRSDKPVLARKIEAIGGRVVDVQEGSILFDAELSGAQLLAAARMDEVLWIDRWSEPEVDMDNARIQGGANYVEAQGGYTGQGVRGHVYEGAEANHPDFTTPLTNVSSSGGADSHGHCTAGIVFGNGSSNPAGRGMAPDAVGFFTQYGSAVGSRNSVIGTLVNTHQVMFTTASWGNARTTAYTSVSADADDIIFDHRIPWTQSQSNAGNQQSRPQAWAKNIFSIGGVRHNNNANPADDSWAGGGGSTGPAADGRIKPDLSAYYDSILCSDRTGTAGYSAADWYSSFGGTSGATPIVAGHNAIAIQMYTDGLFRNPLPVPGGSRFDNRPLAQTLKALMIANADQYAFNASSSDNRREHVGWGFPSLRNLYDNQNRMLVIAEDDPLTQGASRTYQVTVGVAEPELKVCMTFVDPAGNPASALARINDLSLKVTAPNGTVYHGNVGLESGNYSVAGGSPNTIDTVECVFVQNPAQGSWTIEVSAPLVAVDANVATPGNDATFALCAVGVNASGSLPRYLSYGDGCGPAATNTLPTTFYEQFGTFDLANQAFRLTPNGAGGWDLSPCNTCYDPNVGANLGLGDDTISRGNQLGFAFPLPSGGTTSAIDIDSNGWIGLITGAHGGSDFSESVAEFLANPARIAGAWDDLNPATGGSVHFTSNGTKALASWVGVPEFSATGSNTFQIQLFPNGEIVLAYGAMTIADCIVGYSAGNGAADPGPNDLTNPSGGPVITLGASAPPRIGTTITMSLGQIPAGAASSVLSFGFVQTSVDLTQIGMEGCTQLTPSTIVVPMTTQGSGAQTNVAIPNDTNLLGNVLYTQGSVIAPGANTLGILTSNGGALVFGN